MPRNGNMITNIFCIISIWCGYVQLKKKDTKNSLIYFEIEKGEQRQEFLSNGL